MSGTNQSFNNYDYEKNPIGDYNPNGRNLGEQIGLTVINSDHIIPPDVTNKVYDMVESGENSIPVLMRFIEEIPNLPWRIKLFFALQVGLQFDKIHMKKFVEEAMEKSNESEDLMMKIAKTIQNETPK